MKKKLFYIISMMILAPTCVTQAQTDVDEPTVDNQITVTDSTGKKEVIDLPEGMTFELDSLLKEYNAKMYMTEDTNCNMRNMNPVYTKEVYIKRLSRIPSIIEMPFNNVVKMFIERYCGRLRNSVSYMLGASNFYMPIFEEALEMYNLPLELKYLPVIESALNPSAVSHVGATGLWQFMINTAKRYGLDVNTLVDERRDPIKASYAAAHYLSDLYKLFGDWNLVIASYNCGPNQINKAIHRAKGVKDYWKIYPYLPQETRGYVPAFIAANYIMTYYCEHNICPMSTKLPAKSDTVMVNKNIHLEQIASVCNVPLDLVRALNPQYRNNIVPGEAKISAICLPENAINKFLDLKDSVYNYKTDSLLTKRKEVDVEETHFDFEPKSYKSSRSSKYTRRSKSHSSHHARKSKSVTVKDGDTLSEIAARHHTTVGKLKRLNGINGSSIRAGKKIKVK